MSSRATHWCYLCRRPIQIHGQADVTCPNCGDGFVQEISEAGASTSGFDEYPHRRSAMVDALSSLTQRRAAATGGEGEIDARGRHSVMPSGDSRVLIVGRSVPDPAGGFRMVFGGGGGSMATGGGGGYLAGPRFEVLFEQLLLQQQNVRDQGGPPPAPRSAIDAMPTVTIGHGHLRTDLRCPVCQDLYHAGCIVPWLVQHNSCPVCRHPLPSRTASTAAAPGGGADANDGGSRERRNSLSFLWPFGSSSSSN